MKKLEKELRKNGLESYLYNVKSTLDDEKIKDKVSEEDKTSVLDLVDQAMEWLDSSSMKKHLLMKKNKKK